jgi:hypothetical protein
MSRPTIGDLVRYTSKQRYHRSGVGIIVGKESNGYRSVHVLWADGMFWADPHQLEVVDESR